MTTRKTFKFTVSGPGYNYEEFIEAVNPPEARRMAESRFGDGGNKVRLYGFNEVR